MKKFTFIAIALMATMILGSNAFGQITQVGTATVGTATSGSITIPKPAGIQVGDVMFASITENESGDGSANLGGSNGLTGWTLVTEASLAGNNPEYWGYLFYKVAVAADVSATDYNFDLDGSAEGAVGSIVAFRGVDVTGGVNQSGGAGGPFDLDPGNIANIATDATLNAATISTNTANAAVVMFSFIGTNTAINAGWTATNPATLTELFDNGTSNNAGNRIGAAWGIRPTAGATGAGLANLAVAAPNGSLFVALRRLVSVNAGPDQLVAGTSVVLNGSTTASSPVYVWTQTGGPAGPVILTPGSPVTSVTGLVSGNTYTFRLTVNGTIFDEVVVRALAGTNLWASASSGQQIASYTVAAGSAISGPTNMFVPSYPSSTNTYSRTAAIGRSDKPALTSGHFYWLGTSDNPNENNGLVEVFGSSATGGSPTRIGSLDLNGGSGTELGFVRLCMGPDGTGWILAGDGTNLYLAKFASNGLTPVAITIQDATVELGGGTAATFVNGDICMDQTGRVFALANNGSGVTQIFIGNPTAATTLTKKWDLVDPSNVAFTGSVNGVAFDALGALYISTSTGLFYINPATVNGPAGTVQCSLVQAQTGLQDLGSNVFPTTILLPIKLASFTVTKQGNNALLNWTTANEMNTDHFVIERSYDGVNFVTVGTKQAAGYSSTDIQYSFADPITVQSGIIYYRLRTIDISAEQSLSKIIPLRLSGGIVKNFTVYPNPFSNNLKIEINSEKETEITVRLHNATGQMVVNRNTLLQKGANVVVLSAELATLQAGMYVVEIISEDGKQTQKIIKR